VTLDTFFSWFDSFFWQPSCFFSHEAWARCGPLDENLDLAMDLDLWIKLAKKYPFVTLDRLLSTNLRHSDAKTTALPHHSDLAAVQVIALHYGEVGLSRIIENYKRRLLNYEQSYLQIIADRDGLLLEREQLLLVREQQLSDYDNKVKELEQRLVTLRNSYSWRLTSPCRWLADKLISKDR
jgi:hypothetical protein